MSTDLDIHLTAIAAGDATAFAAWLAGAELPLRRRLRPFASSVDTEAVLQEALLRVWQSSAYQGRHWMQQRGRQLDAGPPPPANHFPSLSGRCTASAAWGYFVPAGALVPVFARCRRLYAYGRHETFRRHRCGVLQTRPPYSRLRPPYGSRGYMSAGA